MRGLPDQGPRGFSIAGQAVHRSKSALLMSEMGLGRVKTFHTARVRERIRSRGSVLRAKAGAQRQGGVLT